MAKLLDGKLISAELREKTAQRVKNLKAKGVFPGLAVILVGKDPASEIYVRNKENGCKDTGIESFSIRLEENTPQRVIEQKIEELNNNPAVHGILVQLPLPKHIKQAEVLAKIKPQKDVDGFHVINSGRLFNGLSSVRPCTPKGAMEMIHRTGVDLNGKEAVIVGRSNIVGKPMAIMLLEENCTVTICHSRTKGLAEHTKRADVLVVAVGKPGMITGDMIKPGAIVIDVGINRVNGKVVGDVDFSSAEQVAGWITPVPGGVGKMTITELLENTVQAAERTVM